MTKTFELNATEYTLKATMTINGKRSTIYTNGGWTIATGIDTATEKEERDLENKVNAISRKRKVQGKEVWTPVTDRDIAKIEKQLEANRAAYRAHFAA